VRIRRHLHAALPPENRKLAKGVLVNGIRT
jgi:hypothetical protein